MGASAAPGPAGAPLLSSYTKVYSVTYNSGSVPRKSFSLLVRTTLSLSLKLTEVPLLLREVLRSIFVSVSNAL